MKTKIMNKSISLFLVLTTLISCFAVFFAVPVSAASNNTTPSIQYSMHVQNVGWQPYRANGSVSGTEGLALRGEAIKIKISGMSGGVKYKTHIQNIGWTNYSSNNAICGSVGKSLRMEAIAIELTGEIAKYYDVEYRVHVENIGWMGWVKNGKVAGTEGKSLRLEGIQIKLVAKSTTMTNALYKINASDSKITCGFDGYVNTKGRHEGIDFSYGIGKNIYSLTDGVITNIVEGKEGSKGLSTIAIYNKSTNKTIIYLHANPNDNLKVGDPVKKGESIGTESWRGMSSAKAAHTHVEVRNGSQKNATKSVNDYVLSNTNPKTFWENMGYTVK